MMAYSNRRKSDGEIKGLGVTAEWLRVPFSPYRNYEVSSEGEVRRNGKVLAGRVDRYGYRTILLWYAGLSKSFKVHRLVCAAFHGLPAEGQVACHIDGSRSNNRATNLIWGSASDNVRHSIAHGTFRQPVGRGAARGEANPNAKFDRAEVQRIRDAVASGVSCRQAARTFGCSAATISRIAGGLHYAD